ncbi:ANTAR domain-containing protein [Chitinophaga sp. S165]|uniref:ANTAR domain-containing protein n=1 Tax=Chitinophaga sp. S165 TaxID=2135462 RepID=UPI000D71856B|nr:ANTAR domain-containing protein [Chitinophaga sp. S165]PWV51903.1 hypothetical protein C7475_103513 [Chitinophaga sp. S165]
MREISNPTRCLPGGEKTTQLPFNKTGFLKDIVTKMGYTYNSEAEKLIEQSKHILMLREGWDEEDALPIDEIIWENATSFLKAYVGYFDQIYLTALELPEINPVRDGSIDLEWRTSKGRLLINFNHRNLQKASFYGDRYANEDRIKGDISIKGVEEHLALWMKNCL